MASQILHIIAFGLLFTSNFVHSQDVQYNLSASAILNQNRNLSLSLAIFPTQGNLFINITGPDSNWFGVGFGNNIMTNTYAIVCSKDTASKSICQENKLGAEGAKGYGQKLTKTITVLSDTTNTQTGIRSIYVTRNISINDANYFSFPTWTQSINIIYAIGDSDSFSTATTYMGPGGTTKLLIANRLDNNLTVNTTQLGSQIILNHINIYPDENVAQFNISGPSDVYFGIGYNATVMGPDTYAIICNATACYENQITGHGFGNALDPTTKIVSNAVVGSQRTVVFNRKRNITAQNYFEFPTDTTSIPIIYAIGQSSVWIPGNSMSFTDGTYGTVNIDFKKVITPWTVVAKSPLFAVMHQSVDIEIFPLGGMVNITLTGPDSKWFGIGFNATVMDNAYSIVCSNEALCFEQLLGEGYIGQRFPQQHIQTISDTKSNGIRTVKLTRKQVITRNDDANYQDFYSFPSYPVKLPIIYAYGSNDIFITNQSSMSGANIAALQFTNKTNRHNITASLHLFQKVNQTVKINVLPDDNRVEIVFVGPPNVWYGIGFNAQRMNNTYAIVVDELHNAHEYILGEGNPGTKLQNGNIILESESVVNGIRTCTITRPLAILENDGFDFPVTDGNLSVISAYGTRYPYNTSTMSDATVKTLNFKQYTPSNTSNESLCKPGVVYYGTSAYVQNGFTVGLYIYCDAQTIQMTVDYVNYAPNWFGIVFNSVMAPSPNATIFTTGKTSETQRDNALYSYDLGAQVVSKVVYHPERNWRKLSHSLTGTTLSIRYEQDLSKTKWDLYTREITFRYAYGTPSQGTRLQQHTATDYSQIWKFNLATGAVSSTGGNIVQTVHGIIMILSWSILTTVGIFCSRYRVLYRKCTKNKALWFFVHRGVQCTVVVFVLIAFGIAVYFTRDNGNQHFSNTHECVGLTVVILAVLQPFNAWFRPHPPKRGQSRSVARLVWEILHKSFGYITWIMAQIAVYLGIGQLTDNSVYKSAFVIWIGCVFAVFVCLSVYAFCYTPQIKGGNGLLANGLLTNDRTIGTNVSPGAQSIGPADNLSDAGSDGVSNLMD